MALEPVIRGWERARRGPNKLGVRDVDLGRGGARRRLARPTRGKHGLGGGGLPPRRGQVPQPPRPN